MNELDSVDIMGSVVSDRVRLVSTDARRVATQHHLVEVTLSVQKDLFFACEIFESKLVEPIRARGALALQRADGPSFFGIIRGWHLIAVHATDHDRSIGIAVMKRDEHRVPDARRMQR